MARGYGTGKKSVMSRQRGRERVDMHRDTRTKPGHAGVRCCESNTNTNAMLYILKALNLRREEKNID